MMRMKTKSKNKLIAALFVGMSVCLGVSAFHAKESTVAKAQDTPPVVVEGTQLRLYDAAAGETLEVGTGLRFVVKANFTDLSQVKTLGVLVNVVGETPTVDNTPTTVGEREVGEKVEYITNYEKVKDYKQEGDGVSMKVALMHLPANHFHDDFVCRAYYELETGGVQYSEVETKSVIDVINAARAGGSLDEDVKTQLQGLCDKSTDHTYTTYGDVVTDAIDGTEGTRKVLCECGAYTTTPTQLYHYNFNPDNGEEVIALDGQSYGSVTVPAAPEKADHTFLGWYDEEDNKLEATSISVPYVPAAETTTVTYTAKWFAHLTEAQLLAGVNFNTADSVNYVKVLKNSVEPVFDTDHLVISTTRVYTGDNVWNGLVLNSGVTLNVGDTVEITYSATTNFGLNLNGAYNELTAQATPVTESFVVTQAATDGNIIFFSGWNGVDSNNSINLYSVKLIREKKLTQSQLSDGYYFTNAESLSGVLNHDANITVSYDDSKNAMKLVNSGSNQKIHIKTEEITLSAGDAILVSAYSTVNEKADLIVMDGDTNKYTRLYNSQTKFVGYAYQLTSGTTLNSIDIAIYGATTGIWINFVQVVKKNTAVAFTITEQQLIDGYAFDSAAKVDGACTQGGSSFYHYNETEQALQATQVATNTKDERCLKFNFNVALNAGDKIKIVYKAPINGVSIRLNNSNSSVTTSNSLGELSTKSAWTTYTLTIPAGNTYTEEQGYLSLICYSVGNYYIRSITLERAS